MDLEVGTACNNACIFCSAAGTPRRRDLLFSQIVESLQNRPSQNDTFLTITGGEPTIRQDILEIISTASGCGFREILLQTNGRRLKDPEFTRALSLNEGLRLLISFHGHTPEIHEAATTIPGSFNETVEGMANALKAGLEVSTLTVITKANYRYLPEITSTLIEKGIRTLNFAFPMVCGRTEANFTDAVPSYTEAAPFVHEAFAIIERSSSTETPSIQDWPYCFAKGIEQYANEKNYPEETLIYVDGVYVNEISERLKGKIKNSSCERCIYYQPCEGFQLAYSKQMGTDEFVPVTEQNTLVKFKDINLEISGSSYPALSEECWFAGRDFGGFLVNHDEGKMVPMTNKGRYFLTFLTGESPASKIRSLFGDEGISFLLSLQQRGYVSLHQAVARPPHIEALKQTIRLPAGREFASHFDDERFELPLYNPWPEHITAIYHED